MKEMSRTSAFTIEAFIEHFTRLWQNSLDWCQDNSFRLMLGCIGIVFSLLLFFVVLWIIGRKILPAIMKRFDVLPKETHPTGKPLSCLILWIGIWISVGIMALPQKIDAILDRFIFALCVISVQMFLLRGVRMVSSGFAERQRIQNPQAYASNKLMMDFCGSLFKLLVWCLSIVFILQRVFMFDVTHLFISAGIVGLGVAFAAQNTVANVFGAFSILGSRLFSVGDRIKVNDIEGYVEKIGFRSVQIRALYGQLIDVPNRLIADSKVENFSRMLYRREHFCYGLVYQTTPEQIRKALKIIEEIGADLASLLDKKMGLKFFFMNCSTSSLDLEGFVWFKDTDANAMRAARSRFNQEVVQRFTDAGLNFAYPTTTVFLQNESEAPENEQH